MNWTLLTLALLTFLQTPRVEPTPASPPASALPTTLPTSSPANPEASFDQRLAAADAQIAGVKTLRADFEQAKRTPLLKRPLVSRGTVATRDGKVKWTTTSPRPSEMLVTPASLSIYFPNDQRMEVYPVGAEFKDLAGAPLPSIESLRDRFDIAQMPLTELGLSSEQASKDAAHLLGVRLTPRQASLKAHVMSVGILIDTRIPAATRVIIIDTESDRTEMTLSEVKVNAEVSLPEVALAPAEGTKTVYPLGPVGGAGVVGPVRAIDQADKPR